MAAPSLMIHFTGAVTAQATQQFQVADIRNVSKLDISASPLNNNTAEYYLIVNYIARTGNIVSEKVKFPSSSARNTSYTNTITAISNAVA